MSEKITSAQKKDIEILAGGLSEVEELLTQMALVHDAEKLLVAFFREDISGQLIIEFNSCYPYDRKTLLKTYVPHYHDDVHFYGNYLRSRERVQT